MQSIVPECALKMSQELVIGADKREVFFLQNKEGVRILALGDFTLFRLLDGTGLSVDKTSGVGLKFSCQVRRASEKQLSSVSSHCLKSKAVVVRTWRMGLSSGIPCLALYLARILKSRQVVFPVPLLPRMRLDVEKCLMMSISSGDSSKGNSSQLVVSAIDLRNCSVIL